MPITAYHSGQIGNIFFLTAAMLAHAKKYGHTYYSPTIARACKPTQRNLIPIASTAPKFVPKSQYFEPHNSDGDPYFSPIPNNDYMELRSYLQSFRYFDWCREDVLRAFNFPIHIEYGITALHVRRGDCVNSPNFPIAPKEYYINAVKYMQGKGFNKFRVFSDAISWCKEHFKSEDFNGAEFEYFESPNPVISYVGIQNCENVITARSTFSLTAAWINSNPNKIVCVPTTRHKWWRSFNVNILDGTEFVEIDFENKTDEWSI